MFPALQSNVKAGRQGGGSGLEIHCFSRSDVSCRVERFYASVGSVGLGLLTVALDRGNGLHTQEQVKLA